MKYFFAIFIYTLFILACGVTVKKSENQNSAQIVFFIGDVKIEENNKVIPAKKNMELNSGMIIKTGDLSQCNIQIGSKSFISVKEKSTLLISSLLKNKAGNENTTLELKLGKTVINPKKLLKNESFKVKTPTAIAAVRGTKFVVESHPNKKVRVAVVEGKVELKRRIRVLEDVKEEDIESAEIIQEINNKVNEERVMVSSNETGIIDNPETEIINKKVEVILDKLNKEKINDSKLDNNEIKKEVKIIKRKLDNDINKADIIVKEELDKDFKEDVDDFEKFIEKKEDLKNKKLLTIISPVRRSKIYIDDKFKGYGSVAIPFEEDKEFNLKVVTRDFKDFTQEIKTNEIEGNILKIALEKEKLLERIIWRNNLGREIKGNIKYYNNNVIVSTSDGKVYNMNREGAVNWTRSLKGGLEASPYIYRGKIYIVTNNQRLHVIKLSTGKILWNKKLEGTLLFGSSPVIVNDNIVVATNIGIIYLFDQKGNLLWKNDLSTGIYSTPAYNDKYIFIGSDNNKLYALELDYGNIEWKAELNSRVVASAPLVVRNSVYVCTYRGNIYAFDSSSGRKQWVFKADGGIVSTPIIYGNSLIVGSKNGSLYRLALSNGHKIWTFKTNSNILKDPVFYKGSIYVSNGQDVISLNVKSGRKNWSYYVDTGVKTSIVGIGNNLMIGTESGEVISLRIDIRNIIE